jgi:hypothetical protein
LTVIHVVWQGLDLKNYLSRDPPTGSPVDLSIWQYLGGRLEDGAANYDDSGDMVDEATPIGPPVGSREARYEGIPLTVSRDQVGTLGTCCWCCCVELRFHGLYGTRNRRRMICMGLSIITAPLGRDTTQRIARVPPLDGSYGRCWCSLLLLLVLIHV